MTGASAATGDIGASAATGDIGASAATGDIEAGDTGPRLLVVGNGRGGAGTVEEIRARRGERSDGG